MDDSFSAGAAYLENPEILLRLFSKSYERAGTKALQVISKVDIYTKSEPGAVATGFGLATHTGGLRDPVATAPGSDKP